MILRNSLDLTVYDTIMPVNIFIDDQKSVWGLNNIYCDNFSIKNDIKYSNGNYIDKDLEDCDWKDFAISWNQWLYTDLSSSIYDIYLVFDLKITIYQMQLLVLKITMEKNGC